MAEINKRKAAMTSLKRVAQRIREEGYGINNDEYSMRQDEISLQSHFEKFAAAHDELISKSEDDEVAVHIELWDAIEEEYKTAMAALQRELAKFTQKEEEADGLNSLPRPNPVDIKLERLSVPKFDGTLRNWLAFKDSFETLIHSQVAPEAYKLGKLREAVQGDAVALVGGMYTGGYEEVWKALKDRYDSPRQLADIHVARFIGMQPLLSESTSALLSVVDTVRESLRALAVMKLPVDKWDALVVPIVVSKLPTTTQQAWGMSRITQEIPTVDELLTFVERRAHSLSADVLQWPSKSLSTHRQHLAIPSTFGNRVNTAFRSGNSIPRLVRTNLAATVPGHCAYCNDSIHRIGRCPKLLAIPVAERFAKLKSSNLCFNCLKPGHSTSSCSSTNCRVCNGRHHTLLCRGPRESISRSQVITSNTGTTTTGVASQGTSQATAQSAPTTSIASGSGQPPPRVELIDIFGINHSCRLLCDPGSQVSFITSHLFNQLALPRDRCTVQVEGIGSNICEYTRGRADVQMRSIAEPSFELRVNFHIITSITSQTPVAEVADHCWQHLRNISLADDTFGKTGKIDALIGADIWGQLITDGIVRGEANEPVAQRTHLGWVVFGPATATQAGSLAFQSMTLRRSEEDQHLDELLRKIFGVDDINQRDSDSTAIDYCEQIFVQTHRQLQSGFYEVQMPFRADAPSLGSSHQLALRQFHQLERKLASDPELKQKYIAFMKDYQQLGHMHPVRDYHGDPSQVYFIPHHAVTSKFRVVFNASAKTTNGISLNDTQLAGPPIQELLVNIIHRLRLFGIAITADVEKMFRQVRVDPRHRQWQQILWREAADQPIRPYQLATVTYGTKSGPYLAVRAMIQCGMDHCHKLLDDTRILAARQSILNDFYVDDYLTSAPTVQQASQLGQDVASVLQEGHFYLRKWRTNKVEVLAQFPHPSSTGDMNLQLAETTVLGLHWDSSTDELFYRVRLDEHASNTKRTILSDAARLYDPTGMLSPIVIVAKLIIQKLWQAGLGWDEPVPPNILNEWLTLRNQLKEVEAIRIPRWLGMSLETSSHLYGFCDASIKAYAAVIYLSTKQKDGTHVTRIITAKTKVAPIKSITIPRLELCAAHLLTNLMKNIRMALHLEGLPYTLWSDSKIVLHWLNKNSSQLKQYVASRVAFIQKHSSVANWNHIRTQFNPADCASRGISPSTLVTHTLWWQGPLPEHYPMALLNALTAQEAESIEAEMKSPTSKLARAGSTLSLQTYYWQNAKQVQIPLVERFSDLGKLLRTTAIIFRWKKAHRCKRHQPISAEEQDLALQWHIKAEQQRFFGSELSLLHKGQTFHLQVKSFHWLPFWIIQLAYYEYQADWKTPTSATSNDIHPFWQKKARSPISSYGKYIATHYMVAFN